MNTPEEIRNHLAVLRQQQLERAEAGLAPNTLLDQLISSAELRLEDATKPADREEADGYGGSGDWIVIAGWLFLAGLLAFYLAQFFGWVPPWSNN